MSEAQRKSNDYLKKVLDGCQLGMATRGQLDELLPVHLWEPLRQNLQSLYRKATGEPMATLTIELSPTKAA